MSTATTQKKYTFFWGNSSPFSNWHKSQFEMDELEFNCAEQAMMYYKAILFEDDEAADKIMSAKSPREQKALGRSVKGFDLAVWEKHREHIMYDVLFAKFSQNGEMMEALLKTEDTIIAEMSPYDKIWGTGLAEDDSKAQDESQWQGLNLLGKALMQVRETLYN